MALTKTFENLLFQSFSIPPTFVHYFAPLSPKLLEKLSKTCKYFYWKHKTIFCEYMYTQGDILRLSNCDQYLTVDQDKYKIVIKHGLCICDYIPALLDFSKINILYLKRLCCGKLTLSYVEFELLISSGSIEGLNFQDVIIENPDKTVVPIETILEKVPNMHSFQ